MRAKVRTMTGLLEETFGVKMVSHRAGRWGFNATYARILVDEGYRVDCSVTPHKSWAIFKGDPRGPGGPDYTAFADRAYYLDLDDIREEGDSALLEVPFTVLRVWKRIGKVLHRSAARGPRLFRALANRLYPPTVQLRPRKGNLKQMCALVRRARAEQRSYVEFMLHSSEFMPGGSPTFRTERDIENLYDDLHELFGTARLAGFQGATLAQYAAVFRAGEATLAGASREQAA
jgi:hypothetical protein